MRATGKTRPEAVCGRAASRASSARISSASVQQAVQPARCCSSACVSEGDVSPSRYAARRASQAEQFTSAYLLCADRADDRSAPLALQRARQCGFAAVDERLDVAEGYVHRGRDLL